MERTCLWPHSPQGEREISQLDQRTNTKGEDDTSKGGGNRKMELSSKITNVKAFHKRIIELEALEACYWLKATGFSLYARMYEERKFPIDLDAERESHKTLDLDSLESLVKRLETLNKCGKLLQLKTKRITSQNNQKTTLNCSDVIRLETEEAPRKKRSDSDSGVFIPYHTRFNSSSEESYSSQQSLTRVSRAFTSTGSFPADSEKENLDNRHCDKSNEIRQEILISINNQFLEITGNDNTTDNRERGSFYDNVPSKTKTADVIDKTASKVDDHSSKMINRNISSNSDIKYKLDNHFFGTDLNSTDKNINLADRHCSVDDDDDDDLLSISSQEDEEEIEETESLHSLHHLDVPNGIMGSLKASGMGSVDSGVPSSPILRSPSVRKRRVRWHSFQVSCERESILVSNKIISLSAGQLNVLRKLSLLRLTALLERYSCPNRSGGWNWTVPKLLKRLKSPDYRDKNTFGVPLLTIAERTGCPLPQPIILALNHLSRLAVDNVGIFRKSGMKTRIDKLRALIERTPDKVDFDGYSVYDVADTLKQYFRELPEPLLTSKLADTFISIHKDIPKELRLQAMQLAIVLMPDENRDALQTLLLFLNDVASHSYVNQMSEKNLATCFVPAFFHLCIGKNDKNPSSSAPKKFKRSQSIQCQRELDDTTAAQECLAEMMKCVRFLFCVPEDVMMKCQFTYIEQGDPVGLDDLCQNTADDAGVADGCHSYIDNCFTGLLQEISINSRSSKKWELYSDSNEIVVSYRKMNDGYPLRLWKAVTEINASPEEILRRVIKERHLWDDEIVQWEVLETIDRNTDVFYYESQSIAPSVKRDFVILRSWRRNLSGGSCGIIMTSVQHNQAPPSTGVRGTLLACRCLIEPVGLGRSRMSYIARIDIRGHSSRYYNKAIAPRSMASGIRKVRDSFNCGPDGPETNV